MKAKELKEACIKEGVIDINLLDDENLFSEFITKLCKEQREICAKDDFIGAEDNECIFSRSMILNAPEPEL